MKNKMQFMGALRAEGDQGEAGEAMKFIAATSNIARDGWIIEAEGWMLDLFRSNPVILWSHDMFGSRPPIGRAEKVYVDGDNLMVDIVFDQKDEFAREIERKYRDGFLNALSVQWKTHDFIPAHDKEPRRITKAELYEISGVPVPSDPGALKQRNAAGMDWLADQLGDLARLLPETPEVDEGGDEEAEEKLPFEIQIASFQDAVRGVTLPGQPEDFGSLAMGAQLPHSTGLDEEGSDVWFPSDPIKARKYSAFVREADADKLQFMLLHHNSEGKAVWRAVADGMAALYAGIAEVPDEDTEAIYEHLARHYRQLKKTPPEFIHPEVLREYDADLLAGLFGEGEAEMFPGRFDDGAEIDAPTRAQIKEQAFAIGALTSDLLALLNGPRKAAADAEDDQPEIDIDQLEKLRDSLQPEGEENG